MGVPRRRDNFLRAHNKIAISNTAAKRMRMRQLRHFRKVMESHGILSGQKCMNPGGKPSFVVHCGAAFVTPPYNWLAPMTCLPYGIQNSKMFCRNSLFPEASRMIFSRNRAPVVSPPYFVPMNTANCRAHLEFGSSG